MECLFMSIFVRNAVRNSKNGRSSQIHLWIIAPIVEDIPTVDLSVYICTQRHRWYVTDYARRDGGSGKKPSKRRKPPVKASRQLPPHRRTPDLVLP